MKTVKSLLGQVYQWNKVDFWSIISVCVFSGIFVNLKEVHPIFEVLLIVCLLFKVTSFMRSASMMPALGADTHQFSWKYIQSMPLNKKEILVFCTLSNFFIYLPIFVWFLSFQSILFNLFDFEFNNVWKIIGINCCILLLMLLLTPMSLLSVIHFPRRQFSRKSDKSYFYQQTKWFLILICGGVYAVCTVYYFHAEYNINLLYPLIWVIDLNLPRPDGTLLFLMIEVLALGYIFRKVLHVWQNEFLSYVKIDWNSQRDVPLIVTCIALIILPFQINFMSSADYYRKDPLLKNVHIGKMEEALKLINTGTDINAVNKYGATVLMAAAENGNLSNFIKYEKLGAKREGILRYRNKKPMDIFDLALKNRNDHILIYLLQKGYVPKKSSLVDVASRCNSMLNDLLFAKGADINATNDFGNSALHIAARGDKAKCFPSVVSLIEMGADVHLKDKDGKTALSYVKNDQQLSYYLEKKGRQPAGK